MILVLGATGTTGGEVARQLIAAGVRPRLLVRNRAKAAQFEGKAEIVEGELENAASLEAALVGVEKLYLVASSLNGFDLEMKVIDAAKTAGVRHVVKLSAVGAGADRPVLTISQWHGQVEKHLMDSGLAWTMLRPGNFMTNAILFWADTIKTQGAFYQPTADGRWASIAPEDVAAVAVLALTTTGHEGQGYTLTGDKAMNGDEYAGVLSEVLGKPIKFVDVPPDVAQQGLLLNGMPPEYAEAVMNLMGAMRAGRGDLVTDTFEQVTRRKPISFADWVRKHIAAFQ
jgi:(4-alkanoyl-5-oxo-2,5-dihydrofuran-3-yl)methyl phosphate reductase